MTADPHPAALTPEQIARTVWADILARISECPVGWPESGQPLADIIATAIRSAVQAEREACAKIADEWHEWYEKPGSGTGHAKRIAHHIRGRSTETDHDR